MTNQETASIVLNQPNSAIQGFIPKKVPAQNINNGSTFKNNFYFQEYKSLKFWNNLLLTFWFLIIAGAVSIVVYIVVSNMALWYIVFPAAMFVVASSCFIHVMLNNINIKRDFTNTVLPANSKVILPSLVKIYRRLSTNSININWLTIGIAFYGILTALACLFSSWIINLLDNKSIDFGSLVIYNNDRILEYVVYSIAAILVLAIIMYVVSNTLRGIRISKIDSFYGFQIVHINEINQIKKSLNKRNKWVFLSMLILIFFVFWVSYRITKKFVFNSRKSR
jgi:hypothetical protein